MISKGQVELFRMSIVAQDDDHDYDESGWVAVVVGDWAALTKYGHCSCYDTWASITGGGVSDDEGPDEPRWDWTGTPDQLVSLARGRLDPGLEGRSAEPGDYDFDHLMNVYSHLLEWDSKGRNIPESAGV